MGMYLGKEKKKKEKKKKEKEKEKKKEEFEPQEGVWVEKVRSNRAGLRGKQCVTAVPHNQGNSKTC